MRALVVGSINVDLVVRVPALPGAGVTVLGADAVRHAGGKGGNQAAALARLGAETALVGATGQDADGDWSIAQLQAAGVDTTAVARLADVPTGLAMIAVDDAGENFVVVSRGANAHCAPPLEIGADVVVVQLEIPAPTVHATLRAARASGACTVLNAAPAEPLVDDVWGLVDLLVVNADEARVHGPQPAVGATIVTLGSRGAQVLLQDRPPVVVPAPEVVVVDSTGAGDCFTAAAAFAVAGGADPVEAARFAVAAASLSVRAPGARGGHPSRAEAQKESERIQASS
ncbi:MAG: ribokinase [Frankiales bacterium]|nr:ribokinase [Frankiales bacterium]